MDDRQIREEIKKAAEATQTLSRIPSFDEIWVIAEAEVARTTKPRRHYIGWVAAAAVMGLAVALWPSQKMELSDDYMIADALLNSTSWSAPSDALLPEHQFDIYQEIFFLLESTNGQDGSLL